LAPTLGHHGRLAVSVFGNIVPDLKLDRLPPCVASLSLTYGQDHIGGGDLIHEQVAGRARIVATAIVDEDFACHEGPSATPCWIIYLGARIEAMAVATKLLVSMLQCTGAGLSGSRLCLAAGAVEVFFT
jgi:hypothetical protein